MTDSAQDRDTLRRALRLKRQSLTPKEQALAAEQLLSTLLQKTNSSVKKTIHILQQKLTPQTHVALYFANDGEISPSAICQYCWQNDIVTYLPVVDGETLVFARYDAASIWQKNRFGIQEPIDNQPKQGEEMDIIFLPLVGFDNIGGRLGMGGGFYDKTFANKQVNHSPLLIGLAHDCQQVEQLSTEHWDVPLDGILTNSQWH